MTAGWTQAEFNVFGDGSYYTANFNPGFSITVYTSIRDVKDTTNFAFTYTLVDSCVQNSATGETNNLILGTCTQLQVTEP